MTMLKPAALTHILCETNTGGVLGALLLNTEGALLAFSGPADRDARVTAAISSNIWAAYSKRVAAGRPHSPVAPAVPEQRLMAVLMDCEEGRVCVLQVAGLLLCVYASAEVGFGMLRLKAKAIADCLEQPLIQVASG